jgi:hypothetical protein
LNKANLFFVIYTIQQYIMPIVILILLLISATGALTVAGVIDPVAMLDKAKQTIFNTQKSDDKKSDEDLLSSNTSGSPADIAAQSKANGDDTATTQIKVANAAYDAILAGASKEATVDATLDAGGDTYLTNVRVEEAAQQVANEAAAQEAADQKAVVEKAAQEAAAQQAAQEAAVQAEQLRLAAEIQAVEDQAEQIKLANELQAAQEAAALQAIQYAVQAAEAQAAAEREAELQAERDAILRAEREAEAQAVLQAALEAERERLAAELIEVALQAERDRAAAEVEAAKRQALDMLSAYILNGLSVDEAKALSSVDMYGISATVIQATIIEATNARTIQLTAVDNVMNEMKSGILLSDGVIIRPVRTNGGSAFIEAGRLKAIAAAPNILPADISRQAYEAYAIWESNLITAQTDALNYLYDIMMAGESESSARLTSKVAQYDTPEVDIMYYVNKANYDILPMETRVALLTDIVSEVRTGRLTASNGTILTPQNNDRGSAFILAAYNKLLTHKPLGEQPQWKVEVDKAFAAWKTTHIKEKWRPKVGYEFGGIWSPNYNNPATGAKSCPPTFHAIPIRGTHNVDSSMHYCTRPYIDKPTPGAMRFGGMYTNEYDIKGNKATATPTKKTCGPGFTSHQVYGSSKDGTVHLCVNKIPTGTDELAFDDTGMGMSEIAGMIGKASGGFTFYPGTNVDNMCVDMRDYTPYTKVKILGRTNFDYDLHYCLYKP